MTTPQSFWKEVMTPAEQQACVTRVIDTLRQQLGSEAWPRVSVAFAPDPPTSGFPRAAEGIRNSVDGAAVTTWGHEGKALVVGDASDLARVTPSMFELRSEALFIVAFREPPPDLDTLSRWLTSVLVEEPRGMPAAGRPAYALMEFDWGDLVSVSGPVGPGRA